MSVKVKIQFLGTGANDSNIEAMERLEVNTLAEARSWAESKALSLKMASGTIVILSEYGTSLTGTIASGSFDWIIRNL